MIEIAIAKLRKNLKVYFNKIVDLRFVVKIDWIIKKKWFKTGFATSFASSLFF